MLAGFTIVKILGNFIVRQCKNMVKILFGQPLYVPGLGAMTLEKEDINITNMVLKDKNSWYDTTKIIQLEKKFCEWNNSKYSYTFMSGRVALTACIRALKLVAGDEVVIPGYTCVVVQNSFIFEGIKLIYCDIELETYGLDFNDLINKVTDNTKAILLQHLYGFVCKDIDKIIEFASSKKILIIEDCAQSTGAIYKNIRVGNFGEVGFYSFENSKVITSCAGGIAVSNNDKTAAGIAAEQSKMGFPSPQRIEQTLLNIKYHYFTLKYKYNWFIKDVVFGLYKDAIIESVSESELNGRKPDNYEQRMPAAIAIIALNQLSKIDLINNRRALNAMIWNNWCADNGFRQPFVIKGSSPVYLRYPVLVSEDMKSDLSWAKPLKVTVGVWFISQLHPVRYPVLNCKNAEIAVARCINFPTLFR